MSCGYDKCPAITFEERLGSKLDSIATDLHKLVVQFARQEEHLTANDNTIKRMHDRIDSSLAIVKELDGRVQTIERLQAVNNDRLGNKERLFWVFLSAAVAGIAGYFL